MSTIVRMDMVRVSYPHLFQPRVVQAGDEPKYGCAFIIPKNHPALPTLIAAIEAEKAAKWGANVPPAAKTVLYDGDTDPKYNTKLENNGCFILNTSAQADRPPLVVDTNGQKIINAAAIYAGCYVNMEVGIYPYDSGMSKGISAGINGVQFVQDGEQLGNVRTAEEMFGAPAGAPPPIAGGVVGQPAANPYAQPAPVAPVAAAPYVGVPVAPAPVAPQPAGVPPVGAPSFLG